LVIYSSSGWAADDPFRFRVYGELHVLGDICR
jgi:hypothetical protein